MPARAATFVAALCTPGGSALVPFGHSPAIPAGPVRTQLLGGVFVSAPPTSVPCAPAHPNRARGPRVELQFLGPVLRLVDPSHDWGVQAHTGLTWAVH